MSTPAIPNAGSPIARNHHNKRELKSGKLVKTQILSSDFLSKYVDWRKSRIVALPPNRKCDRWYQAMINDNIWHRWFSDGTVGSEIMLSRSALAHIYDNVKSGPSIGIAKRGQSVCPAPRTRNTRIKF
jgi:hypothetical protein